MRRRKFLPFAENTAMKRLLVTGAGIAALLAALSPLSAQDRRDDERSRIKFELLETTIPEIQKALQSNVITIARLTRLYLNPLPRSTTTVRASTPTFTSTAARWTRRGSSMR